MYSRVQMDLFKARQKAQREYQALLDASGLSQEEAERRAGQRGWTRGLSYPAHHVAGTASNTLVDLEPRLQTRAASAVSRRAER